MSQVLLSKADHSNFYSIEDTRSCHRTCYDRTLACLRQLFYGGTYIRRMCCSEQPLVEPTILSNTGRYVLQTLPWNDKNCQNSKGLCLFLHGMNASAKQWEKYTRQFPKHFPDMHYLPGTVFKAGNCSLESAGDPFVEVVENYLEKFPGKPITFIATSNGARLASYIQTQINPELFQRSRLTVFSIAGVHGGTVLMDLANRICFDRLLRHHPDIKKDLSFNSNKSNSLISALRVRQKVWEKQGAEVVHHFFATLEDEKVRPPYSSLPYLESTPLENYHVIGGETHETIVDRVQEQIFNIIKEKSE